MPGPAGRLRCSRCSRDARRAAPRSRCGRGRRSAPATCARASMVTRWSPRGFSHAICSTPITTPACCCGFTLVCVGAVLLERAAVGADRQHVPGAEVRIEPAEALRHPGRPDELVVARPHRGVRRRVRRVEAPVLEHVQQGVEAQRPGRLGVVARLVERRPGDADPHVTRSRSAWAPEHRTPSPGERTGHRPGPPRAGCCCAHRGPSCPLP